MPVRWDVERGLLDADFAADVDTLLAHSPYAWAVVQGFRSEETQNALYQKYRAGGPLAAPPGHSAHEHGLAVDVCEVVDGHDLWDTSRPAWRWLWQAVAAHPRLHSGHEFPTPPGPDDDHIQSTTWGAVRARLVAAGQWNAA